MLITLFVHCWKVRGRGNAAHFLFFLVMFSYCSDQGALSDEDHLFNLQLLSVNNWSQMWAEIRSTFIKCNSDSKNSCDAVLDINKTERDHLLSGKSFLVNYILTRRAFRRSTIPSSRNLVTSCRKSLCPSCSDYEKQVLHRDPTYLKSIFTQLPNKQ